MKKLLVIVDEQNNNPLSLEKAGKIAKMIKATIEVVTFIPKSDDDTSDDTARIATAKQNLTQQTLSLAQTEANIPVSTQVICTDNKMAWLTEACKQQTIDFVVKAGHRSETLLHTPTDWHLIRELHCPLFITTDKKWKSQSAVMVTVDVSSNEKRQQEINTSALQWAKIWTEATQCALHVVYIISLPKPILDLDIIEIEKYEAKRKPQAEENIQDLLNQNNITNAQIHISTGIPSKLILHTANKLKTNVVIMGSIGRKGIQGFLLGNTAEHVLTHLHTDLLIIKPQHE